MVVSFKYPWNRKGEIYDNVTEISFVNSRNGTYNLHVTYFDKSTHFEKKTTIRVAVCDTEYLNISA